MSAITTPLSMKSAVHAAPCAPHRAQDKQTLLKPLHGLRGWFALTVFVYHIWPANAFFDTGTAFAVHGFFCLSGFILAYVYRHTLLQDVKLGDYLEFVRNRFSRVIPLYFVTAGVALLLILAARTAGYRFNHDWDTSLPVIVANFLAFDVVLYTPERPYVFYPYDRWSVSVEIWLYLLLFPLLAWIYSFIQGRRRVVWAGFICALGAAILGPFWYTYENFGDRSNFFGRGISYFALGFFIYALRLRTLSHRAHCGLVALLIVCGLGYGLSLPVTLMPLAAGLLIIVFAYSHPEEPLCRWFSNRLSIFLGEISYSLYLWHSVCLMVLGPLRRKFLSFVPQQYEVFCMAVFAIPLILFLSWLSYKLIEVPSRQYLRRPPTRAPSLASA